MKLFNTLFDTRIARLLFHKVYWKSNWDNFINSLLPHEPDWEVGEHLIVTPTTIRLEVIGTALKTINAELELAVRHNKEMLLSNRTGQDEDCDLLDSLMLFCRSYYENHPFLSVDALKNLTDLQFNCFSKVHELGRDLYRLAIEDWLDAFSHPSSHKVLCAYLSWDAVGRFVDICRLDQEIKERKDISQKRDLSMLKGWASLLISTNRNLSAYRLVSRICERDDTGWGEALKPAKGLSLLDDAGDPDVVHAFVFGNFSYIKKFDATSHYPVVVFIRSDEAQVFLKRANLYKVFLESLRESIGLSALPKLGMAYLVDPVNCQVRGSISASDMAIRYF